MISAMLCDEAIPGGIVDETGGEAWFKRDQGHDRIIECLRDYRDIETAQRGARAILRESSQAVPVLGQRLFAVRPGGEPQLCADDGPIIELHDISVDR